MLFSLSLSLLAGCVTPPAITSPTELASGTANSNTGGQWVTVSFFECTDEQGLPSCPGYDSVWADSTVSWQEWQDPLPQQGSSWYLLTQDSWTGQVASEPGTPQGLLNDDDVQIASDQSVHSDGSVIISTAQPDSSLGCPFPAQLPPLEPCAESQYNGAGHHYINGTHDTAYFTYESKYGYPPDNNIYAVAVLTGNP